LKPEKVLTFSGKTMLFNRGYFLQGAFTDIQELPWKNQGHSKVLPIPRT